MSYNSGVEVLLDNGLNNQIKKAGFINVLNNGAETLGVSVNSISFSNIGPSILTVLGNDLPVGATISFDAGGGDNRFPSGTFTYDSTGGTLLIAYTW